MRLHHNKATEVTGMSRKQDTTNEKKWKQLQNWERNQIEALLKAKHSVREIAKQLGRDRRTIQREKVRGTVLQLDSEYRDVHRYFGDTGQRVAEERASHKGRALKIGHNHVLSRELERLIVSERYSPEAALGWLRTHGKAEIVTICTKTLYRYIDCELFAGISNKDLSVKRKKKQRKRKVRRKAYNNINGKSIEQRPKQVDERQEQGHWEMDCVVGKSGTKACLLVLTERVSGKELIFKLENKTQGCVTTILDKLEKKYRGRFPTIFKSITVDNGGEFLDGERLERSILSPSSKRTSIYYAHPYCAWERGSNENQNKLIRRFVPKGTNIGKLSHKDVKRIQYWMNHYPRRRFAFQSPSDRCSLGVAC